MFFNKLNHITRIFITVLLTLCLLTGCKTAVEKTEEPSAVPVATEAPTEEAAAEEAAVEEPVVEEAAAEEPAAEEAAAEEPAVEETAAEEAAAEEPAVEEAAAEEPAAEEAAAEEPAAEEAAAEEPAAEEAAAEEPAAEEPAAEEPAAEEPAAEEAAAEEAAAEEPAVEEAAAEEPAAEEAAAEEPAAEEPAAEEAAAEEPAAEEPAVEEAAAEEPAAEEPAAEEAAEEEPAAEEAAAEEPAVEEAAEEVAADAIVDEITEEPAVEAGIVATVDGDPIFAEEFTPFAYFVRYQYLSQYQQYAQLYSAYGMPLDSLNEQMEAILGADSQQVLGGEVIDQMTYNKILEKEAEKAGYELSEQDVIDQMKQWLGYEDPAEEDTSIAGMTSYNVDPENIKDSEDLNAEFKQYADAMLAYGYKNEAINYDFLAGYARSALLDNALFEKELENRMFVDEMVNARHILVEDEETAKEIQEKLANGEAWEDLAGQYSIDTSNKDDAGNLGWFARGTMVSEFEEAAFALEPGEISEPVQTSYGYHLINSLGKEVRPLEGNALQAAQNEAYSEWTTALHAAHEIKDYPEEWLGLVPSEPAFNPIVSEAPAEEAPAEEAPAEEAAVEEAAAEEAVVEETAAEEAVVEEAAVEEAVTEETAAEEAVVEETTAEEAVVEEAVAEEAAVEEAAVEEAVAEEAAVEEAAAEEAVAEEVPVEEIAKDNVIAEVDGQEIDTDTFKKWGSYVRYQYLISYKQYAQIYAMYGLGLDELNAQIEAALGEEGREDLAADITDTLVLNKVLEIEAENAGVEVSDSELLDQMKLFLGYTGAEAEEEPTEEESYDVSLDAEKDDADKAAEFKAYAEQMLNEAYHGDIDYDFLEDLARTGLLSQKLFELEAAEHTFEAEMVNARHILVEDEETAKDIKAKLDAGEDWNTLASENSLDTSNKDNGGTLGWFGRGEMVSEFEEAAFALEAGEISDPIKSDYGYHIIASDGKEVRALEGNALENAKNELYSEWMESLLAKHDVKTYTEGKAELLPTEPAFEPLQEEDLFPEEAAEAEVEEAEVEEAKVEEAEVEEAEVEEAEVEEAEVEEADEDDELTIDNTEQDDSVYTIDNDAEVDNDAEGKGKGTHLPHRDEHRNDGKGK